MSLVRWGQDDSNVYVFNNTDGKIECVCSDTNTPNFKCDTDAQMAQHLEEHVKQGHRVPPWVFDVLSGKERKCLYNNQP